MTPEQKIMHKELTTIVMQAIIGTRPGRFYFDSDDKNAADVAECILRCGYARKVENEEVKNERD